MSKAYAVFREPFSMRPEVVPIRGDESIEQIVARLRGLPEGWPRHDEDAVYLNGTRVPRRLWRAVKPRPCGRPMEITVTAPPMGGEGGGKQVLSVVASIALLGAGALVSNSVFTGLANAGLTVSRATLFGKLAGAAVVLAGSSALQALAPTPNIPRSPDAQTSQLGSASVQGNVLSPNTPLPRVVGTRKIFPPFVIEPLIYFSGQDEVVEAVCALAGPHSLEQPRVGDASVDDIAGVEIETREGWPGDPPYTLVQRYARTTNSGSTIRGHVVRDDAKSQLQAETGNVLDALPQPHLVATRDAPDEFWIGLQFRALARTKDEDDPLRVALRLRIRKRGESDWINLPELHFRDAILGPRRATIKLVWRDGPVAASSAARTGWVEARVFAPGQEIEPVGDDWSADSYFDAGEGGDKYVTGSNLSSTDVQNVIMSADEAAIQLDRATFGPGIYDVEILRGYAFRDAQYTPATYEIANKVRDTFGYEGGAESIHESKESLVDELILVRSSSVWNRAPVVGGGVAGAAIRARNTQMDRLSFLAGGYVRDWDGTQWADWKVTDNPAPHLRDILVGPQNSTPLPAVVLDDQGLRDFRDAGWSCNAVLEGRSVADAARIVAGTGYAQLYQSEKIGVVRDRDRSGETPVQMFTAQNMANFSWSRGYPRLPGGFRASFADADRDYEVRQIVHPPEAVRTEQVRIEGLVTEQAVRARLQYDLDSARHRAVYYSFDAPSDAIRCRRGSLIGVASDILQERLVSGRLAEHRLDAQGNVTSVLLDNVATMPTAPAWDDIDDLTAIDDMRLIGATYGLVVRPTGKPSSIHPVTPAGGGWVDLVTPAQIEGIDFGDIAAIGPIQAEYRRLIVIEMRPKSLSKWTITAVPEAPELWQ